MMIDEQLLILRDGEINYRLAAYDRIKKQSLYKLNKAWNKTRKLEPLYGGQLDCLQRVEVVLDKPIVLDKAIVTVVSPGYEQYLLTLLKGLSEVNNNVPVVIFAINESYDVFNGMTNTITIRCKSRERLDPAVKGVIYSCARWVKANHIISLESDTLPIESLDGLWKILSESSADTMAACQAVVHKSSTRTIKEILKNERGQDVDIPWLKNEKFLLNGGLIIGNYKGWVALDKKIASLGAWGYAFIDGGMWASYRDEVIANWAMNHMKNYIELDPSWNVSFYSNQIDEWVQRKYSSDKVEYYYNNQKAKIFHFLGPTRDGENSVLRIIHRELKMNKEQGYIYCRTCSYKSKSHDCSCWQPGTRISNSSICRVCALEQKGNSSEKITTTLKEVKLEIEEGRNVPKLQTNAN